VEDLAVEFRIKLWLKDMLQQTQLRLFLRLERPWIVEHFPVAVAQNVGRVPSIEAKQAGLEGGG
jgi:hypothetical protein